MVKEVLNKFEQIDILADNAGINLPRWTIEVTEENWGFVIDINLKGLSLLYSSCW